MMIQRQIDGVAYRLYNLTKDEMRAVKDGG